MRRVCVSRARRVCVSGMIVWMCGCSGPVGAARRRRERMHGLRARDGRREDPGYEVVEWNRILALRHWIRSTIEIEDDDPTPAREEAFAISRM